MTEQGAFIMRSDLILMCPQFACTHCALSCRWQHAIMASCLMYTDSGLSPTMISRAAFGVVRIAPVVYKQANHFQDNSGPPDHNFIADVWSDDGSI